MTTLESHSATLPEAVPKSPSAESGTPSSVRPKGRLYALDGMRLLAAMSVMLFHYLARGGNANTAWGESSRDAVPGLLFYADYGWLGVEFFFIISGFVICMSCWGRTPGQFFRSRVTRLYPAYWVAVILTTVAEVAYPVVVKQRMGLHDILLNLTMLHEPLGTSPVDGVYWTLWVEMRFYLLFALVVWKGVTFRKTAVFCGVWTVATVIAVMVHQPLLDAVLVPQYSAYFIAGIGFFLIHRFGSHLVSWGIVGMSWLIAQNGIHDDTRVTAGAMKAHLSGTVSALVVTGCFVVIAAVALGWLSRVNWRWLTTAGALTYPLYLLHQHLGNLVIYNLRDRMSPVGVLAVTVASMLLLAWLVHRFAERPLARLVKRMLEKPLPAG